MKFKLGLCSVSFRQLTAKEIIELTKAAGLQTIEWGSDVHAPYDDAAKLSEIAALQTEYGISCSSYGTYFRLGVNTLDELEDYIKAAKILGTDVVRVWCGDKNSEEYSEKEKLLLFDSCKKAADIAKRHGVKLCTECHAGTYTNNKEAALELMQYVDSEAFRTYWQPSQYKSDEENLTYAELISPYTVNIHVFNWKGDEKYPLCQAENIWRKYLSFFQNADTLLLEFMPDGKAETLKKEAKALKEIIL